MTTSFAEWLTDQQHRDDPVGDLARDADLDPQPVGTVATFRDRLLDLGVSPATLAALDRAATEWETNR